MVDVTIAFNSSAALLERNSCQKRSKVLSKIIVTRTMIVLKERSSGAAKITSENRETTLTANSTPLNGVRKAWNNCWYQVGGFSCVTSLDHIVPVVPRPVLPLARFYWLQAAQALLRAHRHIAPVAATAVV